MGVSLDAVKQAHPRVAHLLHDVSDAEQAVLDKARAQLRAMAKTPTTGR